MRLWITSAFVISLIAYFIVDPYALSVDKRIYTHYTTSLIKDLDLNVVNQVPLKETWLLTSSLNYPDVHSNGVAVLWAPFFQIGRWIAGNDKLTYRISQTMANFSYGLLSLVLLWGLLRRFYSVKLSRQVLLVLAWCSPFLWHLIYQPENADITSLCLTLFLLFLYFERARWKPEIFAAIFGLSLFTGVAVKFDVIFYGLLFAHFLWEKRNSKWNVLLKTIIAFVGASSVAILPIIANSNLKDGFSNYTYFDTVTKDVYVLFENLFAPSGYFTVSPFFAILILAFLGISLTRKRDPILYFLLAIPVVEIVLESFNYNHNETFGARHWVNDLGVFALILGYVLKDIKGLSRKSFLGFCIWSGFLSTAAAVAYRFDYDSYYNAIGWFAVIHKLPLDQLAFFVSLKSITDKLQLLPLLLMGFWGVFWVWKNQSKVLKPALIAWVFLGVFSLYGITTGFNFLNRNKSLNGLPPEVLRNAVIGGGPHINSFVENVGCLQKAVKYYEAQGNMIKAERRRSLLHSYILRAAEEIVLDPVNFKSTLVPNQAEYVPEVLFDDE